MKRTEYHYPPKPPRKYPYGFLDWMNSFWQQCRKRGYAGGTPTDLGGLDMDAFLHYFMEGFTPMEAVDEEFNNI